MQSSRSLFEPVSHLVHINKGKVYPITGHEDPEGEYSYSSTLSLTSALDGIGWSTPRPGRFISGKETQHPLYRRLGGPQGRSLQYISLSSHNITTRVVKNFRKIFTVHFIIVK
jgi:hypothetical protein